MGALASLTGQVSYDYDRSGIASAIKDQETFGKTAKQAGAGSKELADGAAKAEKGLVSFDEKGRNATVSMGKLDVSMAKVGATAGIIGGLAAAAIGGAVVKAAEFEQGMANVAAISESARQNIGALSDQAKELGATTAFTARQAADGMSFLAMAGFDANETMSAMPGLLSLAAAGGIELASAADIASNVLSGFALEADQAGRVADVLALTAASANVDVGMMGESMKMVAPVAASLGIGLESLSAAAGRLGDAGIQGTMAGTNLRGILLSLAAPTNEASSQLEALGVEVFDSAGKMRDMSGLVAEFEQGLDGLSDQDKAAALKAIFGKQNIGGFSALLAAGSENLAEFTGELENSGGAAKLMAEVQLDTLQGSITLFQSALDGAVSSIGSMFLPAVRASVDVLAGLIGAFNSAPGPLKMVVGILLAATAVLGTTAAAGIAAAIALGPLIASYGSVSVAAAAASTAAKGFMVALGPIGLLLAGITAAFVAGKVASNAWSAALNSANEGALKSGGSLNDFSDAVVRAEETATTSGKAWRFLTKTMATQNETTIAATDSYVRFGLGLSDTVAKSASFKKELNALKKELGAGSITTEEYEQRVAALADAKSIAAGEGRILTQSQHQEAEAVRETLAAYAEQELGFSKAAIGSEEFQKQLTDMGELQAQGKITTEQAKLAMDLWTEGMERAADAADQTAPAILRQRDLQAEFAETMGAGYARVIQAGEGLLMSEEDRAERMAEIQGNLTSNVSGALSELWASRKGFASDMEEARQKDAAAQAAANDKVISGQAQHNAKLAKLHEKLGKAGGEQRGAIEAQIAEEQRKWDGIVGVAASGTNSAVAEVQRRYDEERAAIRESLAQTVIDHTNSMVLMGEVSAETARGIFGALATAYPDVDVINPATEATLEFNATLSDVLEGDKDPEAIVTAIADVENAMVEIDTKNRESMGIAGESWDGVAAAATLGADGVGSAGDSVTSSYDEMGVSASDAAATIAQEGALAASATDKMASGIRTGTAEAQKAMDEAGRSAATAGSNIRGSFAGVGDLIEQDSGRGLVALEGMIAKQGEVADNAEDLGSRQSEGFQAGADAGDEAAGTVEDSADTMSEASEDAAESVETLRDALEDLPDEVPMDLIVTGIDEAVRDIERLADMARGLRRAFATPLRLRTEHDPQDAATSEGSPRFRMLTWLEDVVDYADNNAVLVTTNFSSDSSPMLTTDDGGGRLRWQRYLDQLMEVDYEVTVRATFDGETDLGHDIADAVERAEDGAGRIIDWYQRIADSGRDLGESGPEIMALLDRLPELANNLDDPEARAEFEAGLERLGVLWDRAMDDARAAEDARHEAEMANIEDRSATVADKYEEEKDRLERLLAIRREGAQANEDGELIELEDFSGEIERAAQWMHELGIIAEPTKEAMEEFYASQTLGANDSIERSEDLLDVMQLAKEKVLEDQGELAEAEKSRHDAAMADIDAEDVRRQRMLEDWGLSLEAIEAAEARMAAARKVFLDQLKAERSRTLEIEKTAHKMALDRLDELKEAEKDRHDARMEALDEKEDAEDEAHQAAMDRLDDEIALEREYLDELEDGLLALEERKTDLLLAGLGDGSGLNLHEAETALDSLGDVLSDFDKRVDEMAKKRRKRGAGGLGKGEGAMQLGLDEGARTAVQAALDSGKLSEDAARRAEMLLKGGRLGAAQMRDLLEESEEVLGSSVDTRNDEVDAIDQQIERQQLLIDKETFRFDRAKEAIDERKTQEEDRHERAMDGIEAEKEAQKEAWDAYLDRVADAKRAEQERHDAKMRQIEAEFRARLIAEGFAGEAGEDPEVLLEEARKIADAIFGSLRGIVGGAEGDVVGTPGDAGSQRAGPIGGGGPPPGGGGQVPGLPGINSSSALDLSGFQTITDSTSSAGLVAGGAMVGGDVNSESTYNQYGDVNVFDASDAPTEFVDALLGAIDVRGV